MAYKAENKNYKSYDISKLDDHFLGAKKDNYENHYMTVQVIAEGLDNDIKISLWQSNDTKLTNATPVEDRQNEAPIEVTVGDGSWTLVANTMYSENGFAVIDKLNATKGRVGIRILL